MEFINQLKYKTTQLLHRKNYPNYLIEKNTYKDVAFSIYEKIKESSKKIQCIHNGYTINAKIILIHEI